ncbi:MAG TPA: SMP-30/gluconolactonase/LRE family protein [Verrucomicrobiae bacterium]|nr:SMP-30/gluconolactonase/LRE family protein [Verrucomicrobiae bacterium]
MDISRRTIFDWVKMEPKISMDAFEIFATGVDHPECIAFDRHGDLWAGGEIGQIYCISPNGKVQLVTTMGGFCAGLAFSPADELFVCNSEHGIVRVTPEGSFTNFATHAGTHKLVCPNYGLFDSAGNFYVTDSGQFRKRNGCLTRFTADGNGEALTGPLGYANGLALSADEKYLFMVESDTNAVLRFEIRKDGSVGPYSIYATECGRFPDGLTLDSDGNLYVCCYASDEIWRISPSGKKELFAWDPWAIRLGSPTNMAFGGKDFDELYFANLARTTITRVKTGCKGQPLANQKAASREQAQK